MLIDILNITKYFGANLVLEGVNFSVESGDRIGLVGRNGSGKSTLLSVIMGTELPDEGKIAISPKVSVGFLAQNNGLDDNSSIIDEMRSVFSDVLECEEKMHSLRERMEKEHDNLDLQREYAECEDFFIAKDGYNINVKIRTVLSGMGFSDRSDSDIIGNLSGGEKTRLGLAKLLLRSPDVLILDEPTNHLDFKTLMWLEEYLQSYKGAILAVSHDRYFLDKICNRICEVENHKAMLFKGNYSKYLILKEEYIALKTKEYNAQQNEIASLQTYADKNIVRASTSQSAKSRLKAIDRMEIIEKPRVDESQASLKFEFTKVPHKELVSLENVTLNAGNTERVLVKDLSLVIERGEKVAFIGDNGIGKTTLLKALQEKIPHGGVIRWSPNVDISYYDQEMSTLDDSNTVIEELWRRFPRWPEFQVRSALGRVLLTGENVFKKVGVLSGGEKAKLMFAILMSERPNVLILDEPTNHLDLNTKEVLEKALCEYEGSILLVSHDRYLLNRVPSKIVEITANDVRVYEGNFDNYLEKRVVTYPVVSNQKPKDSENKQNYYRSQKQRSEEVKLKKRIRDLENSIEEMEARVTELEAEIASPEIASDFELLTEKCNELEEVKNALSAAVDEWALLSE